MYKTLNLLFIPTNMILLILMNLNMCAKIINKIILKIKVYFKRGWENKKYMNNTFSSMFSGNGVGNAYQLI